MLKSLAKTLAITLAAVATLIVLMTAIGPLNRAATAAAERLESLALALMGLRLTLIAGLWLAWPRLIERSVTPTNPDVAGHLQVRRHPVVAILLGIELVLIQNVGGKAWQWLAN